MKQAKLKTPALPAVFELQKKLAEEVCFPYYGLPLVGETFFALAEKLRQAAAPKSDLCRFLESVRDLAVSELTEEAAQRLAWRLAGNAHRLRAGLVVPPWPSLIEKEWVPIEILRSVAKHRLFKATADKYVAAAGADGKVRKHGALVRFRVLAGLPAGVVGEAFWSLDFCNRCKMAFGFSRRNRAGFRRTVSARVEWSFTSVEELYGLRVMALVDPTNLRDGVPVFQEFKSSSVFLAHNRARFAKRLRLDFQCPYNYPDDKPCSSCWVGNDNCGAACHAASYAQGSCTKCLAKDRLTDPSVQLCLECLHKG